jgi:TATA-box binding protein (TBP) (component of TFIID and TFIIIB)
MFGANVVKIQRKFSFGLGSDCVLADLPYVSSRSGHELQTVMAVNVSHRAAIIIRNIFPCQNLKISIDLNKISHSFVMNA